MAVPGMTGGEQKPLIKYNAKAKSWSIDDQTVSKLTMIVDLEHAECGWLRFAEGTMPDFRLTPMAAIVAGGTFPPMPPDVDAKGKPLFKRGFRTMVKIPDRLANGKPTVREFASCSLATTRAVDKLHTQWLAEKKDGMVPVVTVRDYIEAPGQFGKNFEPVFEILSWIERPPDLGPPSQQTPPKTPEPPGHVTDVPGEPEVFDEEPEPENPWA
jgi:hypothetical protein